MLVYHLTPTAALLFLQAGLELVSVSLAVVILSSVRGALVAGSVVFVVVAA